MTPNAQSPPRDDASKGTLVCVVGPSGAGKDTLIDAARTHFDGDARFIFPRRLITRADQTGEPHVLLSREAFEAGAPSGTFLLSWRAHGELYAIPFEAKADLDAGRVVVVNVSRGAINDAHKAWPRLVVIHVTTTQAVLRERLIGRGREEPEAIEARLGREQPLVPPTGTVVEEIDNSGDLATSSAAFIAVLERLAS